MTRTWLRLRGDGPYAKLINLDRVQHLEYRPAGPRGDVPAAPATARGAFAGPVDAGCLWLDGAAADAVARALGLADPAPPGPTGPTVPAAELVAVPPPTPARPEEVEPW